MPTQEPGAGQAPGAPLPALAGRLAYLLKHAQLELGELGAAALAPFGITGRELAVLIAVDATTPLSQQEAARRLVVDRTTMVALIDDLESKGLVQRQQDPADRRRNVVTLTTTGRTTLRDASRASDEAERRFLAPLTGEQAASLRQMLLLLAFPAAGEPGPG